MKKTGTREIAPLEITSGRLPPTLTLSLTITPTHGENVLVGSLPEGNYTWGKVVVTDERESF